YPICLIGYKHRSNGSVQLTINLQLKTPYFFKWSYSKEAELLQSIFTTPYTYLYFSGLSLRKTSEKHYYCHLSKEIMYQSIWNWIQHYYKPTNKDMAEEENENIAIHYIDETLIRVGR
ncbi:MAG TPA: hypothetical protein VIW25_09525, partial [Nitrososphaeraceae archaeon]